MPAPLRSKLGLAEGDTVEISLHGNEIIAKPRNGWDEFFENTQDFGKKARTMTTDGKVSVLMTNEDIDRAASEGRRRGY